MKGRYVLETDFALCRMNIKVHQCWIYLDKRCCHRKTAVRKIALTAVFYCLYEGIFCNPPAVYEYVNVFFVRAENARFSYDDFK